MAAPDLLQLQRSLAAFILDPGATAAPAGRLVYRELGRMGLIEPLEDMFPILKAHLEAEGTWDECVQDFLSARLLHSPHYRDIAPTFLGWLVASGWGGERWPWIPELAHFELLEVLVARFPDQPAQAGLHAVPGAGDRIVLDPATQVVAYTHAVHQATVAAPAPLAAPTWLLAHRDPGGEVHLLDLTGAAAAALIRAQGEPLGDVARDLGLDGPAALQSLLADLHGCGALAGFQGVQIPESGSQIGTGPWS